MAEPTPLNRVKINALCKWMTKLTGYAWYAKDYEQFYGESESWSEGEWYLTSPHYELYIFLDWNRYQSKGRYTAGVGTPRIWNRDQEWQKPYNSPDSITFAPTRTPEALAKDIYRRLYDELVRYETECLNSLAKHREIGERADIIRDLLKSTGMETVDHCQHHSEGKFWHTWNDHAKINIQFRVWNDNESYNLKIELTSLDDVARIVGAFQGQEV